MPWNIPEASWANAIVHPNATYTISVQGPNLTQPNWNVTPDVWNVSIGVTADISLAGTTDSSLNQSLVFTGTQVNFVPGFDMTAPKDAEWEACIVMGLPGFIYNGIDTGEGDEGLCNFLSLGCQNDLEAAVIAALNETESPSCADAASITTPDSCGDNLGWDTLYVLSKSIWAAEYWIF